jgi:PAS domain S-box-containing protein
MRILVADDHELVRKGICSVLATEPWVLVCGEAVDGRDAVEKAAALQPNVVVMDISMPNMNGLEATREIKRLLPDTEILILSQHDAPEMVRQAFKAGARGYVVKSAISKDLLVALAQIKNRESFVTPQEIGESNGNLDAQEILQRSAAYEKALRESEERFRSAMNNMVEGVYTLDSQGRATFINRSAEEMLGWQSTELLGKKMHDVIHYKHGDGTPFPAADCPIVRVIEDGNELREFEDICIRKDGTMFPAVFSSSAIKTEGKIAGIVVSFRDDTRRRETEEALRYSEGLYRAIGESIDYGVWICDAKGQNVYFSPSFLNLVGLTQEQCSELGWTHSLHPEEAAETVKAWQECVREGRFWEREHRFRGVDGRWHHILARGGPIRNADGKILYWAGINLDIQNRKESELALLRSTTQFQLVTDTMAVAVTRCSRDLRFMWVNPRYAAWVGKPAEEIVGHSIDEVLGKERFEQLKGYIARVLEGKPVSYQEQIHFKGIGSRWISVAYSPTFDAEGIADGWVASLVDVTDRRQRDAELAKQARLLDFSFNAVILWDTQARITYWNKGAEELYGWTHDEAMGQVPHALLRTDFPEALSSIMAHLRREERWQGELVHRHKNGQRLTVLSRWALTRDPETGAESITEINIDITKTKDAERELHSLVQTLEARITQRTQDLESATEKLRELSGRLLQTQDEERRRIARELHDGVGQLLAALKMNLSKLNREKRRLSPEAAQSMDENASLIEQASQEIRTMSHLLHPPLLDEVGLDSALRWYVDGFAERSKIQVALQLEPDFGENLPRDLALALFRIVQESLTNVHRHSGSATARVSVTRTARQICLEVKDEGRGIPAEVHSMIASGQSSGVGLRGMRERVRQFGGRLEVHSGKEGTRVVTVLPIVTPARAPFDGKLDDEGNVLDEETTESLEEKMRDVTTILCIDDEATGLMPRRLLLESAGHRVLEARSGLEGIELFQREKVDAVILDYWMSGMKGTTVASELKRINPAVPIIVLSGMSDLPGEAAGLVDQWLVKGSHRAEQLLESISTLLERRVV